MLLSVAGSGGVATDDAVGGCVCTPEFEHSIDDGGGRDISCALLAAIDANSCMFTYVGCGIALAICGGKPIGLGTLYSDPVILALQAAAAAAFCSSSCTAPAGSTRTPPIPLRLFAGTLGRSRELQRVGNGGLDSWLLLRRLRGDPGGGGMQFAVGVVAIELSVGVVQLSPPPMERVSIVESVEGDWKVYTVKAGR